VIAPHLLPPACGDPDGSSKAGDLARYVDCTVDVTIDSLDDGTVDDTSHLEYDGYGFVAWLERDADVDGTVDVTESDLNDRFGNPIETRYDGNGDGFADWLLYGEYDADGNPLRVEIDTDGDGALDERYTYAVSGGLVRSGEWSYAEGDVIHAYTWEYDGLGRQIRKTTFDGYDGNVEWEETTTWHGASEVATGAAFTWYEPGTGEVFQSITWTLELDAQLRTLGYHMVDEVMGEPNATIDRLFTYEGDLEEPASMEESSTSGGAPWYDGVRTWTYDGAGRVVEDLNVGETVEGLDATSRASYDWSCP
jgi:hypothetical protein